MALIVTGRLTDAGLEVCWLMPADPLPTFGQCLREARLKAGLSQQEIGRMTEMPQHYVSSIERGKENPTEKTMIRLAAALGKTLAELLRG